MSPAPEQDTAPEQDADDGEEMSSTARYLFGDDPMYRKLVRRRRELGDHVWLDDNYDPVPQAEQDRLNASFGRTEGDSEPGVDAAGGADFEAEKAPEPERIDYVAEALADVDGLTEALADGMRTGGASEEEIAAALDTFRVDIALPPDPDGPWLLYRQEVTGETVEGLVSEIQQDTQARERAHQDQIEALNPRPSTPPGESGSSNEEEPLRDMVFTRKGLTWAIYRNGELGDGEPIYYVCDEGGGIGAELWPGSGRSREELIEIARNALDDDGYID